VGLRPALAACVLATACAGTGSAKLLGAPVHGPVALVFRATPEVAAKSDRRALEAFARALIAGPKRKSIVGTLATPGEPAPRLEFMLERWDALGGRRLNSATASSGLAVDAKTPAVSRVVARKPRAWFAPRRPVAWLSAA
jgi:hypothetical protein